MKKRILSFGLIASLATFTSIHAEDCCLPEYRGGEPLCDDIACGIYTQYAGPQLDCGWNFFAWGEFLYWRVVPTDCWTILRAENAVLGTPVLGSEQKVLAFKMGYRPAFRVGIGKMLPCFDDWILNADYTWYHHNFSKTFRASEPAFLASTLAAGSPLVVPQYSSFQNKAHFNYDILAMSIQRPNYFGQNVIISPFVGVKWFHRKQTLQQNGLNAFTGLVDSVTALLKFSSVGISGGLDGCWLLCWNLCLLAKADVGLLYAYERKFHQEVNFAFAPTIPAFTVNLKHHDKHLDILAKGGVGLGWGSYFCCNRYRVDLSATFDWMNEVIKLAFSNGIMQSPSTMFVGLTVRGQFDF